jgi:hypothetical protein
VEREYWVQLNDSNAPLCDCADHINRDNLCKHGLAALLYTKDERVVEMLAYVYMFGQAPIDGRTEKWL